MNIPEIGKEYYFFDDGKISPSRCYKAKSSSSSSL